MAKLEKISLHDLNFLIDKPVVLFGSGNIAEKTMRKLGESKVSFIIDNSVNLHGTTLHGKAVVSAKAISPEYLIVVCTTDIKNVEKQLEQAGLSPGKDFVLSPLLNDLLAVSELEELTEDFYFTSGTIPNEAEKEGGGLYYCRVRGSEYEVEKIYSGQCYGAIRKGPSLFFVDTNEGVLEYRDGVIKLRTKLPKHTRSHGISFNSELGRYYITCSKIDAVIEMDHEFHEMRRFLVSSKKHQTGEPVHHVNDNFSVGNSLYVSMFSSSGNWKQDIFDGCIAEF
ncbi:hypothetical protein, partial [Spiribacter roseus]|uniref:hypothetical protein n=1 Tax=Spiribacter roseus TaxID=1855875 RepID=UPI00190F2AF1